MLKYQLNSNRFYIINAFIIKLFQIFDSIDKHIILKIYNVSSTLLETQYILENYEKDAMIRCHNDMSQIITLKTIGTII